MSEPKRPSPAYVATLTDSAAAWIGWATDEIERLRIQGLASAGNPPDMMRLPDGRIALIERDETSEALRARVIQLVGHLNWLGWSSKDIDSHKEYVSRLQAERNHLQDDRDEARKAARFCWGECRQWSPMAVQVAVEKWPWLVKDERRVEGKDE